MSKSKRFVLPKPSNGKNLNTDFSSRLEYYDDEKKGILNIVIIKQRPTPKSTTKTPKSTTKTPKSTTKTPKSTTKTPKSTTKTPKSTTKTPKSTTKTRRMT